MPRSASPPARIPMALAALGAGLAITLVAAPAYAHDELKSTLPSDGTSVATPPSQVVLTFVEPPVQLGAQVVVTGPDGSVSSGTPRIDGDDVVQDVQPQAPAGRYTVEWRVTSDDGHPVSGTFAFTATAAAASTSPSAAAPTATPAPAAAPRRDPLIPSWAWIVAGVIVIAAAIRTNLRARNTNKQRED